MKLIGAFHHYYPPVGGAERSLHNNLKQLVKKGYKCEIICFMNDDSIPFQQETTIELDGVIIHQKAFPTLKQEIKSSLKHADIVITGLTLSSLIMPTCIELKKLVLNFVCDEICFKDDKVLYSIIKSHHVIANSHYTQHRLQIKGIRESTVLFPTFNVENDGQTYEREHILFFNPRRHKGFEIIKHLIDKFEDKKFVIVGDLGFDVWTNKIIEKYDKPNAEYLPNINDPLVLDKLYKKAIVTLVPSQVPETFSMVAAESIWRNTPVIASKFGALPQTIGSCGLTIDSYSNPTSWIRVLHEYFTHKPVFNFESHKNFLVQNTSVDILENAILRMKNEITI